MTNGTDYTDYTLSAASPDDLTAGLAALPGLNPGRVFDAVVTVPECSGEGEGAEVVAYRAALRILDGGGPLIVADHISVKERAETDPGFAIPPPPPAPPRAPHTEKITSVSMAQARVALRHSGLLEKIDEGLKTLPEPQRSDALIAWEYAPTVSRSGALVLSLAGVFGLDDKQLDELFAAAEKIQL